MSSRETLDAQIHDPMSRSGPESVAPQPKRRWFSLRKLLVMFLLIVLALAVAWEVSGQRAIFAFRMAIARADRIVVRDGGFDCCGPVDEGAILFEVADAPEIKAVLADLEFVGRESPCNCCGFPGIDWYRGDERIALTAAQHGEAIRWGGGDLRLSEQSRERLKHWLVNRGVKEDEIERGCGGPRRNLRRHAAQMKLAQTCISEGEALVAKGDLDAAIVKFTDAIKHDVNFPLAYYSRGLAHEKRGDLDVAIRDFTEAIWFNRPNVQTSRAAAAKFITDSLVSIGLNERLAAAHRARGRAYEKTGQKEKAEEDFAMARQLEHKSK